MESHSNFELTWLLGIWMLNHHIVITPGRVGIIAYTSMWFLKYCFYFNIHTINMIYYETFQIILEASGLHFENNYGKIWVFIFIPCTSQKRAWVLFIMLYHREINFKIMIIYISEFVQIWFIRVLEFYLLVTIRISTVCQ